MKKTYLAKLAIVSFTVVAAFAFMGTSAQAQATGTVASTISIATPIVITGDSALAFGVFTAPTTSDHSWTISAVDGVLTDGSEDDSQDLFAGDNFRGVFTIGGENDAIVTYDVDITTNFGGSGLTLSALTVSPTSTSMLSNSGSLIVGVGGTVTIDTGASSNGDALITMTANY